MKKICYGLLAVLLCCGCEKTVTLKYKGNSSMIIIEGNITDAPGPYYVKISHSIGLQETGAYPTVNDAVVSVNDDAGNSETLQAQGNGVYRGTALQGVPGRSYTLTVAAENQVYTALSRMPSKVVLDSIKEEQFKFGGDIERNIIPVYRDPNAAGNNYRFVMHVNNTMVNQHFVLNDEVGNGLVNTQRLEIDDNTLKLHPGDTIAISLQCIDEKVALYYRSLALMGDSGPGGGTTPNNPPGNISPAALGVFSAHTVSAAVLILK